MTGGLAGVPATAAEPRSWAQLLTEAIRPQFRADVYVADALDPVLFGRRARSAGARRAARITSSATTTCARRTASNGEETAGPTSSGGSASGRDR
jgi:hypothetical protein